MAKHGNIVVVIVLLWLLLAGCRQYEPKGDVLDVDSFVVDFDLASASAVVCNDTVYVLFGREREKSSPEKTYYSEHIYYGHVGELPLLHKRRLPIVPRARGVAQAVGNKIYMGLGFCGKVYTDTAYLYDWWEYDCATGGLRRLADFEGIDVTGAVSWATDDAIFVAFGHQTVFNRRVYRYDITDNSWSMVSETMDVERRAFAFGAVAGGRMFVGGGFEAFMVNDWVEFDPVTYGWTRRRTPPSKGRMNAVALGVDNRIFVVGGRYFGGTLTREHYYDNMLSYDIESDRWHSLGLMPCGGAENMIAFEWNGGLYFGLGQKADGSFVRAIYKYEIE